MPSLPLISHPRGDAVIARRRGEPIDAGRFLADVRVVAAALPPGLHVLNACGDRYAFAVTLAAAMVTGRITLLPSTYTAEAVQRLREFAPDAFCVADANNGGMPLPTIAYPLDTSDIPGRAHADDGAGPPPADAAAQEGSGARPAPADAAAQTGGDAGPAPTDAAAQAGGGAGPAPTDAAAQTGGGAGPSPADAAAQAGGSASPAPASAAQANDALFEVPLIDAERVVAYVFTSGSTGVPVPHPKTWGRLIHSVEVAMATLGLSTSRPCTLIGTVPPQHMFGFESTVLLALIGAQAFDTGRPFYPADVSASIERAPPPRVLVSTPVHLRSLLLSHAGHARPLPALDLILSATAPLSQALAEQAEQAFHAPLMEIYGSTETGQIATRRTVRDETWQLMPDVRLEWREGQAWASQGHVEVPTPLGDVLEPRGALDDEGRANQFALTGRTADLVNIAGKRTSIGYLNHQIMAIDGVRDAGFYMPEDERPGVVTRLAAFAVAPGLTVATLLARLRERIEPAFLPRPLVLVDALARNETGKLAHATLQALFDDYAAGRRRGACALPIAADHPAYAGHFPGRPVLPGVVLLDEALGVIAAAAGRPLSACTLASAKFLSPVSPGEPLTLEHRALPSGSIEFEIRAAQRVVARGTVNA